MNTVLTRNFELPPHYRIYRDLTFYRIDSWDSDIFKLYLDYNLIYEQIYTDSTGSNLCGYTNNDEILLISAQIQHQSNFAVVYMQAQDINGDNNESWGIQSFTLSIEPCPYGCEYYDSDSSLYCKWWLIYFWDQQINYYENYYKLYQIYYCNQLCSYIMILPQHNKAMIRFRIYVSPLRFLQINILVDNQTVSSKSITNNLSYEQLFDITLPFFDHVNNNINVSIQHTGGSYSIFIGACYYLKIKIYIVCIDIYIKDFQLIIEKEKESILLIPDCVCMIYNICWECETGWSQNPNQLIQNYGHDFKLNQFQQQCIPNCGDSLIVGFEQCDDGNQIPFDGCNNYQYQCVINCQQCVFGICQECQLGYYLNFDYACSPQCGDGLIIPYLEQCDENGYTNDCYDCFFQCSENCINCYSVICFQCSFGYSPHENQCIPVCGDQIIISEHEECDDGNDIQYDGCYECKYQCHKNCRYFSEGFCKDQCDYGELMINSQCQSICGNSIISGSEQCDDGNNIQYDGCYQCFYSCPLFCKICDQGICLECEYGLEIQNQVCKSLAKCRDGNLGQQECDDGNIYSNDGCYQCKVEENWNCNLDQPSLCVQSINPFMILNYVNKTLQTQYVEIKFSMEVFISNSNLLLSKTMLLQILNVDEDDYNIITYPITEASNNLSNPEYVLGIDIFKQLTNKPILEINLNQQVFIVDYFYYHKNNYKHEHKQQ